VVSLARGGLDQGGQEKEVTSRFASVIKFSLGGKFPNTIMKKSFWFWAWIVLGTVRKNSRNKPNAKCEAWENLVIISAQNPKEALRKAEQIGKESAGDCDGTLRLFGKPAQQYFLGVQNIGVIHETLEDGAEITWNLKRTILSKAKKIS
jgi:hypothetical protein